MYKLYNQKSKTINLREAKFSKKTRALREIDLKSISSILTQNKSEIFLSHHSGVQTEPEQIIQSSRFASMKSATLCTKMSLLS